MFSKKTWAFLFVLAVVILILGCSIFWIREFSIETKPSVEPKETIYLQGTLIGNLILCDVDGDDVDEIVAIGEQKLIILKGDGTVLWQQYIGKGNGSYSLTSGDINGDGLDDFIVNNGNKEIIAINSNGNELWRYNFTGVHYDIYTKIVNITGDFKNEILLVENGNLHVFTGGGSLLWKYTTTSDYSCSNMYLLTKNVTGDPRNEVVFCILNEGYHVFNETGVDLIGIEVDKPEIIWNYDVNPMDIDIGENETYPRGSIMTSYTDMICETIKSSDLDGDGIIEFVIGLSASYLNGGEGGISVLDENGTILFERYWYEKFRGLQIADLDNDGKKEIIFSGACASFGWNRSGLHIVSWNGTEICNRTYGTYYIFTAVSDIDNDGLIEIIVGTEGIHIYKLSDLI